MNNLGREIKKVNEKVYAAQVRCESCGGLNYFKDCPLKEEEKTFEEVYTQFGVPFPQGGRYRAADLGFYQRDSGNPLYQERRQTMEESLSKFMAEYAKRNDENSNLIKEPRSKLWRFKEPRLKLWRFKSGNEQTDTPLIRRIDPSRYAVSSPHNRTQIFKPNRSVVPFSSRLINDSYEEMDVLDYATYLRKMLRERPKMRYQIEASTNENNSVVLEDPLPPKEKELGSFTLPCYINNIYFEKALEDLGASVSVMPLTTLTNLGLGELAPMKLTVKLADKTIKHPKGIAENILVGIGKFVFPIDFIILDMPKDVKVLLILGRPFLSTAHAKIDVFKRKITLRVWNDKITFNCVKPASSLIKRVYMLGLRDRMDLDLEARIMGEALILNRLLHPEFGDFIELNDLNEPLELKRYQVNDLGPTREEGEIIDEPMKNIVKTRKDNVKFDGINEYPSIYDYDRKIHVNCASNLKFSCMIGFTHEMGDAIVGEPFCRASCVETRRFQGFITINNGNDNVAYQMTRSHPRCKHLTNAQCNKMRPLLKVSARDKLNGISHPYQLLKRFYNGILNLGPEYVRDEKMEEWITHGYMSMHEME
ncbi:gag-pol polyprotein [Tanacetum coccineum]